MPGKVDRTLELPDKKQYSVHTVTHYLIPKRLEHLLAG